jgi:radical SAM superfamily enzyme YgiQ (UPF0313 family)
MKKILLISANRLKVPYPVYPLGISYIRTALLQYFPNFEVIVFDCNFSENNELEKLINSCSPDYIGISFRNIDGCNSYDQRNFIDDYKDLINTIRAHHNCPVFIGGAGFSIYPQKLFELLQPDFGFFGEGEVSICELIDCIENKKDYTHIEGLVYQKNGHTTINKRSNYTTRLEVQFENQFVDYYWKNSGMLNIQTKRGCPYNCIYCSYPLIEGRKVRTLDPDMIVENLTVLQKEKGIDYVFFTDSVFNIENNFNAILCEKIIQSGLKIRWGAYFSPHILTREMLALYKQAGLTHVEFGTESLSDQQLKNYGKHFTVEDVIEKSELCVEVGIYYAHFLILGGYGETSESIRETFENSKKIYNTVFFPFVGMRIYPGTRLQEMAIAEGKISAGDDLIEPVYYISEHFDQSMLKDGAAKTGKAWIFPDAPPDPLMEQLRIKKNKKGPIWEYLRK